MSPLLSHFQCELQNSFIWARTRMALFSCTSVLTILHIGLTAATLQPNKPRIISWRSNSLKRRHVECSLQRNRKFLSIYQKSCNLVTRDHQCCGFDHISISPLFYLSCVFRLLVPLNQVSPYPLLSGTFPIRKENTVFWSNMAILSYPVKC